jgi:hypothetical protein
MIRRTYIILITVLLTLMNSSLVYSQGWRQRVITDNQPPPSELVVARLHFGTNGRIGHFGWSHNYPNSDENLNQFISEATGIDMEMMSYRIVEMGSDELFDYPFAYISEPGEMELTEQEVINLREYIERGGFIIMDDFDGADQLINMKEEVRRAFPRREFLPIKLEHRLFKSHFDLNDLTGMTPYVPGGEIIYYGIDNDNGDIAIAAGWNNDLANFWDWYGNARMPLKPATDAFRLGTNAVIYSLTH